MAPDLGSRFSPNNTVSVLEKVAWAPHRR